MPVMRRWMNRAAPRELTLNTRTMTTNTAELMSATSRLYVPRPSELSFQIYTESVVAGRNRLHGDCGSVRLKFVKL